jgi:hypothetical protein
MIRNRARSSWSAVAGAFLVAVIGTACDPGPNPLGADLARPAAGEALLSQQGNRSDRADREFYVARIEPVGDTRVRGIAQFEITPEWFTARVRITGLAPNERVPQHIHVNATCTPAGGILINLDANLTVSGEGPGFGDAYPRANRAGVLQYEARRPIGDLEAALMAHLGMSLADLALAQRNVNFHEPAPPPIPPVGCGEVERIN